MESESAQLPLKLLSDLLHAFLPHHNQKILDYGTLTLMVVIQGDETREDDKFKNIPVNELAAYLTLIDRVYGRISPEGLAKYADKEDGRLEIFQIHASELEIFFRSIYSNMDARLIVLLLFLKCLPNMFKIATEGLKTLAEAYKTREDGRAVSEDRAHKEILNRYEKSSLAKDYQKQIQEAVQQETELANLENARKTQLSELLEALFMEETSHLSVPSRFARNRVKSVQLRIYWGGRPVDDTTNQGELK